MRRDREVQLIGQKFNEQSRPTKVRNLCHFRRANFVDAVIKNVRLHMCYCKVYEDCPENCFADIGLLIWSHKSLVSI